MTLQEFFNTDYFKGIVFEAACYCALERAEQIIGAGMTRVMKIIVMTLVSILLMKWLTRKFDF